MEKRYTPERITELKPNEVFVFGSNLNGYHGGGAARIAMDKFGAVWGQGVGLQGQSYAIPTMQGGVETIKPYVDEFIRFAKQHLEQKFLVRLNQLRSTRITQQSLVVQDLLRLSKTVLQKSRLLSKSLHHLMIRNSSRRDLLSSLVVLL